MAHGGIEESTEFGINHQIILLSDTQYTQDVLAVISAQGEGAPIQAHLWSCYAGAAAKAVGALPCGSIVLGHGPEKSVTYITTNKESIKKSVKKSIENGNYGMSSIAQDMVDNSMEYSLQDMSFGIKTSDGIVLTRTINLFAETINIEGYDKAVTKIEAYLSDTIESLKLSRSFEDIKSPVLRTHGVEEISQFRKERIRYKILRIDENKVDFEKLMKEKRLITPNDPEYESLNREERSMLEPEIQNELLEIFTHDIDYFSYGAKSKENLIDYLIEIAKSKDDGDLSCKII